MEQLDFNFEAPCQPERAPIRDRDSAVFGEGCHVLIAEPGPPLEFLDGSIGEFKEIVAGDCARVEVNGQIYLISVKYLELAEEDPNEIKMGEKVAICDGLTYVGKIATVQDFTEKFEERCAVLKVHLEMGDQDVTLPLRNLIPLDLDRFENVP